MPRNMIIRVQIHPREDAAVASVAERNLLAHAAEIGDQLSAVCDRTGKRRLHLDLARVKCLNSQALARLISLHRKLHTSGGQLTLCNVQPALREILRSTRLDQVFAIRSEPSLSPCKAPGADADRQAAERDRLSALFDKHGLIGQSQAMRDVFQQALTASRYDDLPVLILGETGTGKELLAKTIHALDPERHDKPFIPINCSCISHSLAESDLFGHRKGAFTGAEQSRLGAFRAAHGGTLLLDEIGDLDPRLQPKLLRVLQEGHLLPVGEDYEHPVDVRVIAATNRPLRQMIVERQFREELYERLNVLRIEIPPLRERPEDVEPQARHFLMHYQARQSRPVLDFSPQALEALRNLPWGGNTRQLQNLIRETLARKASGDVIELSDLPPWVHVTLDGDSAASVAGLARVQPANPESAVSTFANQQTMATGTSASVAELVRVQAANPESAVPTFANQQTMATGTSADELVRALAQQAIRQGTRLPELVDQIEQHLIRVALEQSGGNQTRAAAALGLTRQGFLNKLKKHKTR